jgi:hypothetical protein
MSKSKKGGEFERNRCKLLSKWWSNDEHDDLFWRSSQSGGRATQRAKFGKRTINADGDIAPTHSSAEPLTDYFLFECKTGYKDQVDALKYVDSDGKVNMLQEWWRKASTERYRGGKKEVMLIIKRRGKEVICVISVKFLGKAEQYNGEYEGAVVGIRAGMQALMCVNYDQFFSWLTPETIKLLIERNKRSVVNGKN